MPSNDSADQAIENRRWKAWDLRVKGKSYRAIGEALGVSGKTAHQDCQVVLTRVIAETNGNAEQDRAISLARLDRALDTVEEALLAQHSLPEGDGAKVGEASRPDHELRLKALDRLMKIEERRAKLLGLDAPAKQEIDAVVSSGATPADAARLVRRAFGEHASQKPPDATDSAEPNDPVSDGSPAA